MDGILAVDKPRGWTSHDVVARVRRLAGQRRVGHAGTLDPMATGVLLVCLGEATRLSEMLMDGTKWYLARVSFGIRTDTDDAEGQVVETAVPAFGPADLLAALARQVGALEQVPPSYAAIKNAGVPAYKQARKGTPLVLAPRSVTVHAIILLASRSPRDSIADADLLISCSKGTYIRAIARDLGTDLGCGAHLSGLRRLGSGSFTTLDCLDLRSLDPERTRDALEAALHPLDAAVARSPAAVFGPQGIARVGHGLPITGPVALSAATLRLYDQQGRLAALATPVAEQRDLWHPHRVFGGEG